MHFSVYFHNWYQHGIKSVDSIYTNFPISDFFSDAVYLFTNTCISFFYHKISFYFIKFSIKLLAKLTPTGNFIQFLIPHKCTPLIKRHTELKLSMPSLSNYLLNYIIINSPLQNLVCIEIHLFQFSLFCTQTYNEFNITVF